MPSTKHVERIVHSLSGRQSAIVMVDDIEQGIDVANGYAAEHLEIQTANPEQVASMITNAGAIFVGPWSPVSLGDYCAGSTHVLPTGGVRYSSGLNVRSFLKMMHIVSYTQTAFAEVARKVEASPTPRTYRHTVLQSPAGSSRRRARRDVGGHRESRARRASTSTRAGW